MKEQKNNWVVWSVIIVIAIIIFLVYLAEPKMDKGNIKIGFVAPLTGDAAGIGQNMKAAAELAVSEINKAGGVNGQLLTLVAEDGKCDGKEAVTAVTKLINVDKVGTILGGACSSETVSSAPIAEKAKVVMLSPLSSNPSITTAGDYIFRDYPSDSFQGVKAADFAVNTLQAKNIAVLSCLDDWCQGVAQVFKDKAVSLGAKIVGDEKFEKTATDLKTQLTKIKAANPDLVYFLSYTDGTIVGLKQAKALGLKTKLLGGDAWNDPKIIASVGSTAEGIMYLQPSTHTDASFEAAMASTTGGQAVTIGSKESYDAVKILAQVMQKVGTNSTKIKDALYQVKDYQGVSGNISFDQNGDLVSASYDIKTVKDGKAVNY